MPTIVHGFDWPDRVVIGTIGEPGARSFYLQARAGIAGHQRRVEKEQSAALAEKIDEILDELMAEEGNPFSVPAATAARAHRQRPLDQPVEPEFRAGTISLGWDPTTAQVVIEAYPRSIERCRRDDEPTTIRNEPIEPRRRCSSSASRSGPRARSPQRTLEVVGAGRPLCPLCGTPMDPDGSRLRRAATRADDATTPTRLDRTDRRSPRANSS